MPKRKFLRLALVSSLALGTFVGPASTNAAKMGDTSSDSHVANALFVVKCGFSHTNRDDMIRLPGRPGRSHNHTYVGNKSTKANSTLATLRSAGTTCDRPGDNAAYWMPTLYSGNVPVMPEVAVAYYRRAIRARVTPFPQGFRMIAGNMMASVSQGRRIIAWVCAAPGATATRPFPTGGCPTRSRLFIRVNFPSCWDGRNLDSADHQSHVAYPTRSRCPKSRPVGVPALTLEYRYPAVPRGIPLALASGGRYSGHADFVNSWDRAALELLVDVCLNQRRACGALPIRE